MNKQKVIDTLLDILYLANDLSCTCCPHRLRQYVETLCQELGIDAYSVMERFVPQE